MNPAEQLSYDLALAFGYTEDNNRDLTGDSTFSMQEVTEELMVNFCYSFLLAYIARSEDMINSNMEGS